MRSQEDKAKKAQKKPPLKSFKSTNRTCLLSQTPEFAFLEEKHTSDYDLLWTCSEKLRQYITDSDSVIR